MSHRTIGLQYALDNLPRERGSQEELFSTTPTYPKLVEKIEELVDEVKGMQQQQIKMKEHIRLISGRITIVEESLEK